jgi:hypothetical protein
VQGVEDCERNEIDFGGSVTEATWLMNGDFVNSAIVRDKGTVARAFATHKGEAKAVVRELFLTALNREPTEAEVKRMLVRFPLVRGTKDGKPEAPYEDLLWALLNCGEFALNH